MDENIIGEQNSIISENSDKKDFSALYNFLQTTLNNHYEINSATENKDSATLFAKNIKILYDANKNKTFPQNDIITKANHADSTVNIIAQFKDGLSSKSKYSIINALNSYNDVISTLAQDTNENPIHCQGQCVGFCTETCSSACVKSCIGQTQKGQVQFQPGCGGCGIGEGCSSECTRSCGKGSCTNNCAGGCSSCASNCNGNCQASEYINAI